MSFFLLLLFIEKETLQSLIANALTDSEEESVDEEEEDEEDDDDNEDAKEDRANANVTFACTCVLK